MKKLLTATFGSLVAALLITLMFGGAPAEAVSSKVVVRMSPSHLQTADMSSAQFWVTNLQNKPIRVTMTRDHTDVYRVWVKKGMHRINLPSVEKGSTSPMSVSTTVRGRTYSWSGYVTRPVVGFITRAAEKVRSGTKSLTVSLSARRPMTQWTNTVIVARDGRLAKCKRAAYHDDSNVSPYCTVSVPGNFVPEQVGLAVFSKSESQRVSVSIDREP